LRQEDKRPPFPQLGGPEVATFQMGLLAQLES
jgi:hypothetical protein